MIHCVVWAKLLLKALFGSEDESNYIKDIGDELKEFIKTKNSSLLFETISAKLFDSDIKD